MTAAPAPRRAGPLRALLLADRVPSPELDGASARALEILRALQRLGCRITFVAHHQNSFYAFARTAARDAARLAAEGVEVAGPQETTSVASLLATRGEEFDLVLMTPYPIAHRYLPLVRRHAPGAAAVYAAIDLGHVQHFRRARATGNVPDLKRALEAKAQETALARSADAVLVCSEEEREELQRLCPQARVLPVAHAVRPRSDTPPFDARAGLLFLGSFPNPANVDAMRFFVAEVLPSVRAALPEVSLTMVGLDPRDDLAPLVGTGVSATGWVPDLDPYFARSRVFVAPLRYGAGIKIKVLESLARGVPVVATPIAAEGLHLADGESALIASGADEFAAAVVLLNGDRALWERLAAGGRAVARRFFSEAALETPLSALLAAVVRREGRHASAS
jgi:glycosyltransferase involved in cell wall biosynthesis